MQLSEMALVVHVFDFSHAMLLSLDSHVQVVSPCWLLFGDDGILTVHWLKTVFENFKIVKFVEFSDLSRWILSHVLLGGWSAAVTIWSNEFIGFLAVLLLFKVKTALNFSFLVLAMKGCDLLVIVVNNDFFVLFVVNLTLDFRVYIKHLIKINLFKIWQGQPLLIKEFIPNFEF